MAVSSINTSGITVGSDGRLSVSGFSSGIDWKSLINAQMTAKRAPAVQLETKITNNTQTVSAYGDLKTKLASVTTALDALRTAPGSTTNIFATKTASGTTTPTDSAPNGFVSSDISNLLVASISNTAQSATHTIRVQQLAQANQIRSDSFSSTTTALADLGVTAGSFTIGGKSIAISATDTLLDLKSKINNAGAGVSATIVSADATTNYLVLTATATGTANTITLAGDATVSDSLGLTETTVDNSDPMNPVSTTAVKTELVEAKNAILDVDGVTGIVRSSNQVSDVIDGITFSLLKAEPNTNITLKVEPDLAAIKTALGNLVTAYNDLRDFATDQRTAKDRNNDGTIGTNEVGPLAYDSVLRNALAKLGELTATSVDGAPDGYKSMGQVGIVTTADYKLALDDTVLDSKLLTNVDGIQKLFGLSYSTSDSRLSLLSRGDSTASGTSYLNLAGTDVDGNVLSANYGATAVTGNGGADDGSASVNGRVITTSDGSKFYFGGGASLGAVNDIEVTVNRGLADVFYDFFNSQTKSTTGVIDSTVTQLQAENKDYQDRIDTIDARLEITRATLETKYTNMEAALARLTSLQNTIDSYFNTSNSNSGN